jgi:hypothetical protein
MVPSFAIRERLRVEVVRRELQALLGLEACWFERWPYDALLPTIAPGRVILPADEPGVRSYASWTADDGVSVPVRVRGFEVGRFVLVPSTPSVGIDWSPSQRADVLELTAECGGTLTENIDRRVLHG